MSTGAVISWAGRYDLLIQLLTLGRERAFRRRLLDLAALRPGESVLDIGCGTGTLAIAARRVVGSSPSVAGIDPSAEMIARARRKAAKSTLDVDFQIGYAQTLPFADATFGVVLSTVMIHHVPKAARLDVVREARRVMRPSGRLLIVDFGANDGRHRGLIGHLHRTGGVDARKLIALATEAGLSIVESGPVGKWDLQFVLAER